MSFKRLEIYGFKSFADKVVVDVNEGITGIVGPNGSGKSNFLEAIKWVLGEQKTKELRSKSMSEVIFNGTQTRGSMSYCEVTLVFDNRALLLNNTERLFKTLEFDEVAITRKLFRSGNSEYYINKQPCLLKDIRNIISGTGLGRDGYSIIEQGKVGRIITSKPEDRRVIFEEAAGISMYKKRKSDAETKLKNTEESLVRINDIIREIERQLGPLAKQAEDAKQYQVYYQELKDAEVNHYLASIDKNVVEKARIDDKLKGIREESQRIADDIAKLDIRYTKIFAEQNNMDVMISNLKEEQTAMMLDEERRLGQGSLFGEKIANLKREQERISADTNRMQSQLKEATENAKNCEGLLKIMREELDKKRREYSVQEGRYTAITDEILASDAALEQSSKVIMQALDELAGVQRDATKLGTESQMLSEKAAETELSIDRIKKQIENEENNRSEINNRLSVAKTARDAAYKNKVTTRNRIGELSLEQNLLTERIRELSGSISSYGAKAEYLERSRERYDGYTGQIQRLMQEAKNDYQLDKRIQGVVGELVKVPQRLEIAIETALGGAMQNIVVDRDDDVKYIIDVLKQKKLGRVTFLPINSFKSRELDKQYYPVLKENGCLGIASKIIGYDSKFSGIMSGLLGSTIICDGYDNALAINKKYRSAFRIVTLEGEVLSTQGSISGGSRKSDNASILSQERELEQVRLACEKCKVEYQEKQAKITQAREEYARLNEELKVYDEVFNANEIEYATVTERENKSTERLEDLIGELENLNVIQQEIHNRLQDIDMRLSHSGTLEGDIKNKRISVDDLQNKSKQEAEAKKAEKDAISVTLTTLSVSIAELDTRQRNVEEEKERYLMDITRLNEAIIDNESMITATVCSIKNNEERVKKIILESSESEKFNAIKVKLNEAEEYKRKLSLELIQINTDKDALNHEQNSCSERRVKEESYIERIDSTMVAMADRLLEEYGLDHDGAVALAKDDFDDHGAATQITSLRKAINKLGPINPGAIEQYALDGERHKNLTDERDDLVRASDDLKIVIKDLSKIMLEKFETQFATISANFETCFRDIFGGGKGALVLDRDAEDPLSAGVEILAQPPGKKLGSISLFSGGEQALTAIAILFAILKSSHMPFCVLDEIEAALDESNARLFAKYLRRFTRDTQFIVITHRKPTMEQADRLYGVTMEERGVSKIVSVKLDEAIHTAEAPLKDGNVAI